MNCIPHVIPVWTVYRTVYRYELYTARYTGMNCMNCTSRHTGMNCIPHGIPVWTVCRYERYTVMNGIPVWTVYRYERYTVMKGIPLWTVYRYDRYTVINGIPLWMVYRYERYELYTTGNPIHKVPISCLRLIVLRY